MDKRFLFRHGHLLLLISADAPSQQPSLLLQGRSGPVQYVPSVRPSVHHPNKLTTFSPHFPFFLFRPPPKGLIPGNKNTQHGQKAAAAKKEGRNCLRNYYYFYVYGLSVCMDGQIYFVVVVWCGVGGLVLVSWRVGGGWLLAV